MNKLSLCLGYFDSVHIGHKKLIGLSANYAAAHNMTSAVYTFSEDKTGLFNSLYSYENRCFLLKNAGASLIMSDIFSEELMKMSGEAFLDKIMSQCDVGAFFCGYDYTFGYKASCNAEFLSDYAKRKNVPCFIMPKLVCDGEKVSTTLIKSLLAGGEIEKANKLLGTPFFMTGKVVHGRGVGHNFGYPTANLLYNGFLPKDGVYKTLVEVDGKEYIAVTNVGDKPTFDIRSVSIESMLVDFSGDLYDKQIAIEFIRYLRPIYRFNSGEELNKQIQKDALEALC